MIELLTPGNGIFDIVLALGYPVAALIIYWDASRHGVGRSGEGGFFNMSAGAWGACALLASWLMLALYGSKRQALLAKARSAPAVSSNRVVKMALLLVAGSLVGMATLAAR